MMDTQISLALIALNNFEDINEIHREFKKDHFDMILTNPPFGAVIKRTEKKLFR